MSETAKALEESTALSDLRVAARQKSRKVRFERSQRQRSERCTRPSIMVIEDDALMQGSIVRTLQANQDIDWSLVSSFDQARRAIGFIPYDVIAVDLNLSGCDGALLIRDVIDAEAAREIVVLTGLEMESACERLGDLVNEKNVRIWQKGNAKIVADLVELAQELCQVRVSR